MEIYGTFLHFFFLCRMAALEQTIFAFFDDYRLIEPMQTPLRYTKVMSGLSAPSAGHGKVDRD